MNAAYVYGAITRAQCALWTLPHESGRAAAALELKGLRQAVVLGDDSPEELAVIMERLFDFGERYGLEDAVR